MSPIGPRMFPALDEILTEDDKTMVTKTAKNNADTTANDAETTDIPALPIKGATTGETAMAAASNPYTMLKGVPIPEGKATRESKYPWDTTPVGEAFFVPGGKIDTFNTLTSTRNKNEIKKNGEHAKSFIARKFVHDGVAGVAVWRKS